MKRQPVEPHRTFYSRQRHRRQAAWQVLAPVLLAAALMLAMALWVGNLTLAEGGDSGRWAAISTIWLVLPVMCLGLFFLAALAGLVYGLARLGKAIPPYSHRLQRLAWRTSGELRRLADAAVRPLFFLRGLGAGLKALFRWK
jgi:hypothetical protein